MLTECGFVRAQTVAGDEYTFTPAIGRIAELGTGRHIVSLFVQLHSEDQVLAADAATSVLYGLCDQSGTDGHPYTLLGWIDKDGEHAGQMPPAEQVIIARHLMRHGIIGNASPSKKGDGKFSEEFDAQSYIDAARVHLCLSRQEAEELSMTEFQRLFALKFPGDGKSLATKDEYEATMKQIKERRRGK